MNRVPGKYVVWVMAAIVAALMTLALVVASRGTPAARQFHETHSPQP